MDGYPGAGPLNVLAQKDPGANHNGSQHNEGQKVHIQNGDVGAVDMTDQPVGYHQVKDQGGGNGQDAPKPGKGELAGSGNDHPGQLFQGHQRGFAVIPVLAEKKNPLVGCHQQLADAGRLVEQTFLDGKNPGSLFLGQQGNTPDAGKVVGGWGTLVRQNFPPPTYYHRTGRPAPVNRHIIGYSRHSRGMFPLKGGRENLGNTRQEVVMTEPTNDLTNAEVQALGRAVGLEIQEPELSQVAYGLNALLEGIAAIDVPGANAVEPLPLILPDSPDSEV